MPFCDTRSVLVPSFVLESASKKGRKIAKPTLSFAHFPLHFGHDSAQHRFFDVDLILIKKPILRFGSCEFYPFGH